MSLGKTYQISYGKTQVALYRIDTNNHLLTKLDSLAFTTDSRLALFAVEIDVEVTGKDFLSSYTQGDNASVIATDSMKNFIFQQALVYRGATLEGFLGLLGRQFLDAYHHIEAIKLTGREIPFVAARTYSDESGIGEESCVLFSRSHNDFAVASLNFMRDSEQILITEHSCGWVGMQLLKLTGSSFTHYIQDAYTTLPERADRPLFIYMDVFWKYVYSANMQEDTSEQYVSPKLVRDVLQSTFHNFLSKSIQHLIHEMGCQLLERFPQFAEVSFTAQNHTWDLVAFDENNAHTQIYSEPLSAYGVIKLTLTRSEFCLKSPEKENDM